MDVQIDNKIILNNIDEITTNILPPVQLKAKLYKTNSLNIVFLNTYSIKKHVDELSAFLKGCVVDYDVIILSEAWLEDIKEQINLFNINGYTKSQFLEQKSK